MELVSFINHIRKVKETSWKYFYEEIKEENYESKLKKVLTKEQVFR